MVKKKDNFFLLKKTQKCFYKKNIFNTLERLRRRILLPLGNLIFIFNFFVSNKTFEKVSIYTKCI